MGARGSTNQLTSTEARSTAPCTARAVMYLSFSCEIPLQRLGSYARVNAAVGDIRTLRTVKRLLRDFDDTLEVSSNKHRLRYLRRQKSFSKKKW